MGQLRIGLRVRRELVHQRRIVVLGEQPEEDAARAHERRRLAIPPVLEQPPHGIDRPHTLHAVAAGTRHPEHRVAPGSVDPLVKGDHERGPIGERQDREAMRLVERNPRDLDDGPVLNRRRRIIEKPADGKLDWRRGGLIGRRRRWGRRQGWKRGLVRGGLEGNRHYRRSLLKHCETTRLQLPQPSLQAARKNARFRTRMPVGLT